MPRCHLKVRRFSSWVVLSKIIVALGKECYYVDTVLTRERTITLWSNGSCWTELTCHSWNQYWYLGVNADVDRGSTTVREVHQRENPSCSGNEEICEQVDAMFWFVKNSTKNRSVSGEALVKVAKVTDINDIDIDFQVADGCLWSWKVSLRVYCFSANGEHPIVLYNSWNGEAGYEHKPRTCEAG